MPFLIGLVLTLLGAWIGTVLFFTTMMVFSFHQLFGPREWAGALFVGTIFGSLFASPVTLVILPVTYGILARANKLSLGRLAIAGAIPGFVSVLAVLGLIWGPQKIFGDPGGSALTIGLAADGAVTGALCGALLALIGRRLQTGAWRSRPNRAPA